MHGVGTRFSEGLHSPKSVLGPKTWIDYIRRTRKGRCGSIELTKDINLGDRLAF